MIVTSLHNVVKTILNLLQGENKERLFRRNFPTIQLFGNLPAQYVFNMIFKKSFILLNVQPQDLTLQLYLHDFRIM